jgi:hypothetical protein
MSARATRLTPPARELSSRLLSSASSPAAQPATTHSRPHAREPERSTAIATSPPLRVRTRVAAPSRAFAGQPLAEQIVAEKAFIARASSLGRVIARYTPPAGTPREVIALDGAEDSVLVVDRDRRTRRDMRLVAHICSDEPPENAAIAGAMFARHASETSVRCRALVAEDFSAPLRGEGTTTDPHEADVSCGACVRDRAGRAYRIEAVSGALSIPELRWRRHPPARESGRARSLSVRQAVEAVGAYGPIRAATQAALSRHGRRTDISSVTLRLELERVLRSPIVLNCKLRRAVLAATATRGVSLSEIATRCGRVKRDRAGNISGETSWLARRVGILPEGGRERPTCWVHIDVLALIARRGLGVSPREVEPD